MKYIIIYAEGFNDKIMVVNEPETYDNQDRMFVFKKFYPNLIKNDFLPLLNEKDLDLLKRQTLSFLEDDYRKINTKHANERNQKITKRFLGIEYELFVVEDRLVIMCIDLYNINIYAKQNNILISYKAFETKKDMVHSLYLGPIK